MSDLNTLTKCSVPGMLQNTPAGWGVPLGRLEVAKLMLERGANPVDSRRSCGRHRSRGRRSWNIRPSSPPYRKPRHPSDSLFSRSRRGPLNESRKLAETAAAISLFDDYPPVIACPRGGGFLRLE